MRVRWIGVALAVTLLVLELPGQERGKDRVRVEVKTGRPAVKIQIGPAGICTRQAPPGHSRGKAWWKTQPGLELEIGRHPGLRGYLLANPKLSLELRIRADADRDGVLTAKECNRFVALARDHCHSAAKVKTVAKGPPPGHSRGKAWWKTQPGLELQIGRHPGLRGYLLANPKLSLELRIRADADRDGVLTAKECNRFVALARDHCHSAKVKTVAKSPHRNGAAHRSMKPKNTSKRCRGKKARKAKKAGRGSKKSHR